MAILQKTQYKVWAEGSTVTVQFGNVPITMDYKTALELAQFLRVTGRQAKANAGDRSVTIRTLGLLTDAEEDEKRLQRLRDPTARYN